jgi:hypothetical protein
MKAILSQFLAVTALKQKVTNYRIGIAVYHNSKIPAEGRNKLG